MLRHNIEYKSISIAIKSFDEVKGIFTGYASAFNKQDWVNDTILEGSFDNSIKNFRNGSAISINYEHDKSIILASNLIDIKQDSYGLLVQFQVSESAKESHKDIYEWAVAKAKSGDLYMSIGGYVISSTLGEARLSEKQKYGALDIISEFELDHIAITNSPVDRNAKILEVKGVRMPSYPVDLSDSWDESAAEKRWRGYSNSEEVPSSSYKKGFLYFDESKSGDFTSYHFLVVDIIDGEPMINQKAVIACYQAMRGARKGVKTLDQSEKAKMMSVVSKLYDKINRVRKQEGVDPLPDVSMKSLEEEAAPMQICDVDGEVTAIKFLQTNKSLSNTAAKNFVFHLKSMWKKEKLDSEKTTNKNQDSEISSKESLCHKTTSKHGSESTTYRLDDVAKFLK